MQFLPGRHSEMRPCKYLMHPHTHSTLHLTINNGNLYSVLALGRELSGLSVFGCAITKLSYFMGRRADGGRSFTHSVTMH